MATAPTPYIVNIAGPPFSSYSDNRAAWAKLQGNKPTDVWLNNSEAAKERKREEPAMTLQGADAVAGIVGLLVLESAGCVSTGVHESSTPREWYQEGTGRNVVMLGGGVYGVVMFASHARELSSDFAVIRVQTLNV